MSNNYVKRCVSCRMPINEGSAFCTYCGTKVEETPVADDTLLKRAKPKVCPNCKNEVDDDSAFYMNCGTKIDN